MFTGFSASSKGVLSHRVLFPLPESGLAIWGSWAGPPDCTEPDFGGHHRCSPKQLGDIRDGLGDILHGLHNQ